jgi:hypothetical protein
MTHDEAKCKKTMVVANNLRTHMLIRVNLLNTKVQQYGKIIHSIQQDFVYHEKEIEDDQILNLLNGSRRS